MKPILTIIAMLSASTAAAHPGHLAEVAGHGHWLGAAAIGAAIAIGLWAKQRGKKAAASENDAADGDDLQEA